MKLETFVIVIVLIVEPHMAWKLKVTASKTQTKHRTLYKDGERWPIPLVRVLALSYDLIKQAAGDRRKTKLNEHRA